MTAKIVDRDTLGAVDAVVVHKHSDGQWHAEVTFENSPVCEDCGNHKLSADIPLVVDPSAPIDRVLDKVAGFLAADNPAPSAPGFIEVPGPRTVN